MQKKAQKYLHFIYHMIPVYLRSFKIHQLLNHCIKFFLFFYANYAVSRFGKSSLARLRFTIRPTARNPFSLLMLIMRMIEICIIFGVDLEKYTYRCLKTSFAYINLLKQRTNTNWIFSFFSSNFQFFVECIFMCVTRNNANTSWIKLRTIKIFL